MIRFFTPVVFAAAAMLSSVNAQASITDSFKCLSGEIPKFEGNSATFHVEPFLWDNDDSRNAIVGAFEAWNSATGWKMQFKYTRGEGRGEFGDGQYQVRSAWLFDDPSSGYSVNGKSAALPDSNPGQCHWYDSDIELGLRNFRDGNYFHPNLSLYSLMLHEIGHAIGLEHNQTLSVVNTDSRSAGGLFGFDIQFARNLYDVSEGNIKRNFRADRIAVIDGRLRNSFIVEYDWSNNAVKVPYAVTNTGVVGEFVTIEFVYASSASRLNTDEAVVLDTMDAFIAAGSSTSGYKDLYLNRIMLNRISQAETYIGFRVVPDEVDSGPWDDAVRTY